MVSQWIQSAIAEAGLGRHAAALAQLSDAQFLGLLMSDYVKFGVTDLEEKQRLFRLQKALNNQGRPAAQPQLDIGGELLDLDANDGDLLAHVRGRGGGADRGPTGGSVLNCLGDSPALGRRVAGPAQPTVKPLAPAPLDRVRDSQAPAQPLQLSPMNRDVPARPRTAQQAGPAHSHHAAEEVDPPKIRVVVRKRPINKKVGRLYCVLDVHVHAGRRHRMHPRTRGLLGPGASTCGAAAAHRAVVVVEIIGGRF